jgi:hypothetical protein
MVMLCAAPAVLGQQATSDAEIFDQALRAVAGHVHGLGGDDLPDRDDPRGYAFAKTTAGGDEAGLGDVAAEFYGTALADDMVASYHAANNVPTRIDAEEIDGVRVLDLEKLATGPGTYDWKRLHEKYPEVKAIFVVSRPAAVSHYALVRVEVVGPEGVLWENYLELQREPNGSSWKHSRAVLSGPRPERSEVARHGREAVAAVN